MTKETINLLHKMLEGDGLSDGAKGIIHNLLKMQSPLDIEARTLFEQSKGEEGGKTEFDRPRDFRLKRLEMNGFRSFPKVNPSYGINLCDEKGNPCSLFLIGSNGTGKSSLFSAIEQFYTGGTSLAQQRGIVSAKFLSYALKVSENQENEATLSTEVASEDGMIAPYNLSTAAAFCSTYDIQKIEECKDDLTNYIFRQLGYDEVLRIEAKLAEEHSRAGDFEKGAIDETETSAVLREVIDAYELLVNKKEYADLIKEAYLTPQGLREAVKQMDYTATERQVFSKDWKRLRELLVDNPMPVTDGFPIMPMDAHDIEDATVALVHKYEVLWPYCFNNKGNARKMGPAGLNELFNRYYVARKQEETSRMSREEKEKRSSEMRQRQEDIDEVQKRFDNAKREIMLEFVGSFKTFIEKILTDFSDGEKFELKTDKGVYLNINVEGHTGERFSARPNEYLNSFRFVLYCVSLKLALSLWQIKRTKIVTPIVIDDVFDASDFENSLRLEDFVYQIFRTYSKKTSEENINIPLQLIILTHDELMKSAFERGLSRYKIESTIEGRGLSVPSPCICGRLLSPRDSDKLFEKEDGAKPFRNLYMKL